MQPGAWHCTRHKTMQQSCAGCVEACGWSLLGTTFRNVKIVISLYQLHRFTFGDGVLEHTEVLKRIGLATCLLHHCLLLGCRTTSAVRSMVMCEMAMEYDMYTRCTYNDTFSTEHYEYILGADVAAGDTAVEEGEKIMQHRLVPRNRHRVARDSIPATAAVEE